MHSVVLHAAGNSQIGVGHLSRTATLASALLKTQNWRRVVVLWEASSDLAAYFAPKGCEVISVCDRQAALNLRTQLTATKDNWTLITDLLNLQPQDVLTARTQGFQLLCHINDSGSGRSLVDLLVDEDAFKTLADLPVDFQGTGLVGNAYRIIQASMVQNRPESAWSGNRVHRILVSLGGADPANLTVQLLADLCPQLPPSVYVTAIIGPAFASTHTQMLQKLAQHHDNLQVLESPQPLAAILLKQDLIITLGGLTTYEALCLGKPCAAIGWSYMSKYVEALSQMRLLINLGDIEQAPANLLNRLQHLDQLTNLAQLGWQRIDGQGAARIAVEVMELALRTTQPQSSSE